MSSLRHVRRGFGSAKLWNALASLAGVGALVGQATTSDRANLSTGSAWQQATAGAKAQAYAVLLVQRLTNGAVLGNYSFPNGKGQTITLNSKPTYQIGNVLNKFTGLGVGALIYKHIPMLPFRGKIGKFAIPLIAGGIIGGLIDDPSGQATSRSSGYVSNRVGGPQAALRGQTFTAVNAH